MDDDATKKATRGANAWGPLLSRQPWFQPDSLHFPWPKAERLVRVHDRHGSSFLSVRVEQKGSREESRPQTQVQLPQLRQQGFLQLDFFSFRKRLRIFAIR